MTSTAPQIQEMSASEVRHVAVDFSGKLDTGETLTGTPAVVEVTTTALTITNKAVSTGVLSINSVSVPIGEAIQFTVDAATTGTYQIRITCGTSESQTVDGLITLSVG